jgi:hypothetical protein
MIFSVSVLCVDRESADKRPFAGAAILESDFGTNTPFYSPALALNTSLTVAKYFGDRSQRPVRCKYGYGII